MNNALDSRLSLIFFIGLDEDGEEIFQTRSFRNVKPDATDEALYETAVAMASLSEPALEKVERSNTYELNA